MAWFTCTNTIGVLVALSLIIYTIFKRIFSYWERHNVPTIQPCIPFGNITRTQSALLDMEDCYKKLKAKGHKFGGFYLMTTPGFLPLTNDLVKRIMSEDFAHFVNRGVYFNEKDDPLSAHVFAIEDEKWRVLRAKLSPTFTSGKMKMMFQTLVDCANPLIQAIHKLHDQGKSLDIKELVACFTTDVIGNVAFGIECDSFKNPDGEFRSYGKEIFRIPANKYKRMLLRIAPNLALKCGVVVTPDDMTDFFTNITKQTVEYREKNNETRKDFIQLLIDLKNSQSLTMDEISAQAFVFFFAGFETSSTGMTFCLYELAKNMEIQDKVRNEIELVLQKHGGQLTYEAMNEMKYLDQVVKEALRKHPPVPVIPRVCTKDYRVPDSDVILKRGVRLFIMAHAMHYDPEYFPEPEKFKPERFSDENKDNILPFTYQPFGDGPRICIGLRFGMMQMKVGLISILRNFKVHTGKKTPEKLSLDPNTVFYSTLETIYLDTEKVL